MAKRSTYIVILLASIIMLISQPSSAEFFGYLSDCDALSYCQSFSYSYTQDGCTIESQTNLSFLIPNLSSGVHIGPLPINYSCSSGYVTMVIGEPFVVLDGWPMCDENGCYGELVPNPGQFLVQPSESIPDYWIQCWEAIQGTCGNGSNISAWSWNGYRFYNWDIQILEDESIQITGFSVSGDGYNATYESKDIGNIAIDGLSYFLLGFVNWVEVLMVLVILWLTYYIFRQILRP